eukprot:7779449-Prorocentrum_lima.AAC.1
MTEGGASVEWVGRHCVFGPDDGTGCVCWAGGKGGIVRSGHMTGKGCVCVEGGPGVLRELL